MARYLIEVSQPATVVAKRMEKCVRMIGSHFATHARWQQKDGLATGTLVVEADDQRWVLAVVPPYMRESARVNRLEPLDMRSSSLALSEGRQFPIAA